MICCREIYPTWLDVSLFLGAATSILLMFKILFHGDCEPGMPCLHVPAAHRNSRNFRDVFHKPQCQQKGIDKITFLYSKETKDMEICWLSKMFQNKNFSSCALAPFFCFFLARLFDFLNASCDTQELTNHRGRAQTRLDRPSRNHAPQGGDQPVPGPVPHPRL